MKSKIIAARTDRLQPELTVSAGPVPAQPAARLHQGLVALSLLALLGAPGCAADTSDPTGQASADDKAQASEDGKAEASDDSEDVATTSSALNGPITCAIQTTNGHYLTAVGGGGRTTDVLHTDATRIGSWEKFTLVDSGDGSPNIHYGFETVNGHFLTAVGGGGRTSDVMHSDATRLQDWEKLSVWSLGNGYYGIQTINGHWLTAVGGGGRTTDTIHSDATTIRSWETFRLICGI